MKTLSLVIPCKDESKRLKPDEFIRATKQWPWLSFWFIDDGSTDATSDCLARLVSASPAIHAVHLPENRGKAEAVRTGVVRICDMADSDLIGFWDADLATPLDNIPEFVRQFDTSTSVSAVIGSRWPHLGASIRRSALRGAAAAIIKSAIRRILKAPVWDTQCGAKIFTREIAAELFAKPFRTKWLFDVEILRRLGRKRLISQVCELPVSEWHDVPGSKMGLKASLSSLFELAIVSRGKMS